MPTRIHKAHKQEKLWPIRCGPSKIEHILGYSGPVLNGFRFPKTDQWIHQFLDPQAFWPNSLLFLYWYPIGSMCAIYGNIYHQYTPNVSIYTIHGSYGYYVSIAILVKPTALDQRGKKKHGCFNYLCRQPNGGFTKWRYWRTPIAGWFISGYFRESQL